MAQSIAGTGWSNRIRAHVADAATQLATQFPGDRAEVQPLHTVYVDAGQARFGTVGEWSTRAIELLDANRPLLTSMASADAVARVGGILRAGPIRDLRFDFEDGYRSVGGDLNDAAAVGAALDSLPISGGIRIPGLTPDDWKRSISLLEAVVAELGTTDRFAFTIPKFRVLAQVDAAVALCRAFEQVHGVPLRFELQIESPQAVIAADGTSTVAAAIHRSDGYCRSLHYGTYDYSAACGIAAGQQSLEHPAADHAKVVMQAAAAQTGVWVCDGSTQVVPDGDRVTEALELHYRLVIRSLERGYYQGWDMHPGHLVTRWLANIEFYRSALTTAAPRLRAYIDRTSDFDEPASAESLARVLLRGLECGAYELADTGMSTSAHLADVAARRPIDLKPVDTERNR